MDATSRGYDSSLGKKSPWSMAVMPGICSTWADAVVAVIAQAAQAIWELRWLLDESRHGLATTARHGCPRITRINLFSGNANISGMLIHPDDFWSRPAVAVSIGTLTNRNWDPHEFAVVVWMVIVWAYSNIFLIYILWCYITQNMWEHCMMMFTAPVSDLMDCNNRLEIDFSLRRTTASLETFSITIGYILDISFPPQILD